MNNKLMDKKTVRKIDFYLVDSMEIIDFEPIHRHIPTSSLIAIPGSKWFDLKRARKYLNKRLLKFQTFPSDKPDCVITTQYHKEVELPEYKDSLSIRLMYSLTEKNFCHSKKASEPFDAVLVPGAYSKELISRYTEAIIVGFPKYDNFFSNIYRKQNLKKEFNLDEEKKTVLYLPTWAEYSSLDIYKEAIKKIAQSREYNIIFKPHTVTVRKEKRKIKYFQKQIKKREILCIEEQISLDKLFTVADLVIADGMSGAFWESILVANLPTLAINTEGGFKKQNLETEVQEYAIVNNNPKYLMNDLERIESTALDFEIKRKKLADQLISYRDGTAGKRAANAIMKFCE